MKKQISYPKIMQFRNVVADISNRIAYVGKDENGDAIFDRTIPKPVLTFKGTVKLHGTNCGVSYNAESGLWAQSRNGIITPENDNAGFAQFDGHLHAFLFEGQFLRARQEILDDPQVPEGLIRVLDSLLHRPPSRLSSSRPRRFGSWRAGK